MESSTMSKEILRCIVALYDADTEMIVGVLLDGSDINVVYGQPKEQNSPPYII